MMKKIVSVLLAMVLFVSMPVLCFSADEENGQISIEPRVLWEGYDTSVEVAGIEDHTDSYDVSFILKNNSELSLSFDLKAYAVNGIMCNDHLYSFYVSIPSGKKSISKLNVDKQWMQSMGIDEIEYVDLFLWAYDDAKSYKEFETDIIRIETNEYTVDSEYEFVDEANYEDESFTI